MFNDTLTNGIVSFEQLGPGLNLPCAYSNFRSYSVLSHSITTVMKLLLSRSKSYSRITTRHVTDPQDIKHKINQVTIDSIFITVVLKNPDVSFTLPA